MDARTRRILSFEGQLYAVNSNHGQDCAIEVARDMIDGATNALMRLEGNESAAQFVFRVSDRVVAGIKLPTALPPMAAIAAPIAASSSEPMRFYKIALFGFLCGFILGWSMRGPQ